MAAIGILIVTLLPGINHLMAYVPIVKRIPLWKNIRRRQEAISNAPLVRKNSIRNLNL
jgi:hypothetical protein